MKYCVYCGKENPDGAKFCRNCGRAVSGSEEKPEPKAEEVTEAKAEEEVTEAKEDGNKQAPSAGNGAKEKKIIGAVAGGLLVAVIALCVGIGTAKTNKEKEKMQADYQNAVRLYEDEEYDEALALFGELSGYADADGYAETINRMKNREQEELSAALKSFTDDSTRLMNMLSSDNADTFAEGCELYADWDERGRELTEAMRRYVDSDEFYNYMDEFLNTMREYYEYNRDGFTDDPLSQTVRVTMNSYDRVMLANYRDVIAAYADVLT